MFLFVAVAAALLVALIWHARWPRILRNGKSLPRPADTLPFFGNALSFLQPRHKLFQWFTKCQQRFGLETYEISVPTLPPGVVISDPNNLEYVLKNDGLFDKGDFFRQRARDLFGDGIITADGHLWKTQRKAGLHFFRASNLKILIDRVLPQYVEKTKADLREQIRGEQIVDLEDVFLDFTTRLMGKMAYDMNMDNSSPFSKAFEYASGATGERFQNPLWQVTGLFLERTFRKSVAEVKAYGRDIVATAMEKHKGGCTTNEAACEHPGDEAIVQLQGSLINSFIDEIQNPRIIADAALNFLSAGRDTTAQNLTWTFYLLMRNPRAMIELRKEVLSIEEDELSHDSLQTTSLPYTLAVFYESLRLYPPVPFEIRHCRELTNLPDGTLLPQGAIVLWSVWALGRSEEIWASNDLEMFKPERWLEAAHPQGSGKRQVKQRSTYEFPVFNGGARLCLGRRMAELQAMYTIASLVREFEFEEVMDRNVGKDGERITRNSLTLPMEGGLPCRVRERRNS